MPDFLTRNATNTPVLDESQKDHLDARAFSQIADPRTQESERPITSPSFDSQALEQVLPPKRNLPFSKPGPRLSNISSRPGTSSESANNLDTLNAAVTNASSRPVTALSRVTVPATSSPARQLRLELEDSRRGSINQEQGQLPRGQVPASSPLLETSAFGLSSPDVGTTTSRHNTTTQSPRVPSNLSPVQTKSPPFCRQDQQQYQQPINNHTTTTSPASYGPVMTSADLSAYLTTPESERSALVNNWICHQLEDDGFRALCQDVERVWQRIAFGSRNAV